MKGKDIRQWIYYIALIFISWSAGGWMEQEFGTYSKLIPYTPILYKIFVFCISIVAIIMMVLLLYVFIKYGWWKNEGK